ncbi:hypothetical protein ACFX2C_046822 [Malus domestica]
MGVQRDSKLDLDDSKHVIRQTAELRRLCDIQFDSSIIDVDEVCKDVTCIEIAANFYSIGASPPMLFLHGSPKLYIRVNAKDVIAIELGCKLDKLNLEL